MTEISAREFDYTDRDFAQVKAIIYRMAGIHLADSKKQLVYSRLARRLRALRLRDFPAYLDYLQHHEQEHQEFINALTTNLTAFFREPHHFVTLAKLAQQRQAQGGKLRVWCAAASTGEEAYSIAMTLIDAYASFSPPVEIIASDIDSQVLQVAARGIYSLDRLESLSLEQKRRFFLRGTGRNLGNAKIIEPVGKLISFRNINLLDKHWGLGADLDVIFCRNVMIYFDKPTQLAILERMLGLLKNDGLYIAGHSESFSQAAHLVKLVGKTTYQKADRVLGVRPA